ncbi:MAG: hypothetical protein JST47_00595 [Bacteroidetes bacterium]|nr:hypothetical protein [Bacteroidota bacterium]MBS1973152.1 hypothetical protein [Bacteroidota bacterium]
MTKEINIVHLIRRTATNKRLAARLEPVGSTISDTYYIGTIPALVLIDKNSQIIGKYGGFYYSRNAFLLDLDEQLDKIFRK